MTNSSSRLRNNILSFIFIAGLVCASFNLPLIFRETFQDIKDRIENNIRDVLGKDLSIEKIGFFPYGEVVLYNVRLYDEKDDIIYARAKSCHIQFKLWDLFLNKKAIITKINLREPVIFPVLKDLEIPEYENEIIIGYAVELDKYLLVKVNSGKLAFSDIGSSANELGFTLWVRMIGGKGFYSEGWIDLENCYLKEYFLNDIFFFEFIDRVGYRLKASLNNNVLSIEEMVMDFEQFKIGAKGFIENYKKEPILNLTLNLEELAFSEKIYLRSKLFISSIRNLIVYIKGSIKEPRMSLSLAALRMTPGYFPTTLKIDNFYCNLKLSQDRLLIEECSYFLNNLPIGLKCVLSRMLSPQIDLNVISYPGQLPSLRRLNPLNFSFSFSGDKKDASIRGKLSLGIERLISSEPRETYNLELKINDFSCEFSDDIISSVSDDNAVSLMVNAKDITYKADAPGSGIEAHIKEFTSSLYPEGKKFYFPDLTISGYEGYLQGNGFLGFEGSFPGFFFDCEFNNFNIAELVKILPMEYELGGYLKGKSLLDSKAFTCLSGEISVSNGYIKNLKILELISDFLSIRSLKDIYFEDCASNFSLSLVGKELVLSDIRLRDPDVYLDANLTLKENEKIEGNMLVRISTKVLKESFKLRLLFLLMGERFSYADFEFKIGGFLKNPHIKWLDTKFRKNVMRFLSKGGQVAMEKQVEQAIQPLLENK